MNPLLLKHYMYGELHQMLSEQLHSSDDKAGWMHPFTTEYIHKVILNLFPWGKTKYFQFQVADQVTLSYMFISTLVTL